MKSAREAPCRPPTGRAALHGSLADHPGSVVAFVLAELQRSPRARPWCCELWAQCTATTTLLRGLVWQTFMVLRVTTYEAIARDNDEVEIAAGSGSAQNHGSASFTCAFCLGHPMTAHINCCKMLAEKVLAYRANAELCS